MRIGGRLFLSVSFLLTAVSTGFVQSIIVSENPTIGEPRKLNQARVDEIIDVVTEVELLDEVNNLQLEQTLVLQMNEVLLMESISLNTSSVTIRGRKRQRTIIRCPDGEPAMKIWAPNVIIQSVTFEGCHDESAIVIDASTSTSEGEVRFVDVEFLGNGREGKPALGGAVHIGGCDSGPCTQFSVAFRSCRFLRNAATFGGALFVRGVDVSIEDSLFESNAADLTGGAIYLDGKGQTGLTVKKSIFSANIAGQKADVKRISDLKEQLIEARRLEETEIVGTGGAVGAYQFNVMSIEASTFESNIGCRGAGALSLLQVGSGERDNRPPSFSIKQTAFVGNKGFCFPDLVGFRLDNAHHYSAFDISTFGGAVKHESRVEDPIQFIVEDSTFRLNDGTGGGGLYIQGTTSSKAEYLIRNSSFSQNSAIRNGGSILASRCSVRMISVTVSQSRALYGGGVFVWTYAKLIVERSREGYQPTTIENNMALIGGGAIITRTRYVELSSVLIRGNAASQDAGGLLLHQTEGPTHLRGIRVEDNMASAAGGISFNYLPNFNITSYSGEPTIIKNNKAVVAAGILIMIGSYHQVRIKISDVQFVGNKVMLLDQYSQSRDRLGREIGFSTPSLRDLEHEIIGRRISFEEMSSMLSDLEEGHGGAVAITFQRLRLAFDIDFKFENIDARNNEAYIGGRPSEYPCLHRSVRLYIGGMSFLLPNHGWNRLDRTRCEDRLFESASCPSLTIINSTFIHNKATYAAAIFSSNPDGVAVGCNRSSLLIGSDAASKGFNAEEDLKRYCMHVSENEATGVGLEGQNFGTPAYGLVVANWPGELMTVASGEPLAIPCRDEPQKPCPLEILIKDVFNQTITSGIADAGLKVSIESNHVRGAKKYAAKNGVVTIDDTFASGIDITEKLFIFSDSDRRLNLTLDLKTRACQPGEIDQEDGSNLCYKCPHASYSFKPTNPSCKKCETNGICNGGASQIPRNDYWHSTPFSPVFRRCLRRGACDFEGRAESIATFWSNLTTAEEKLGHMETYVTSRESADAPNFTGYAQCGKGYEGILCGSCQEGYGHGPSGACEGCPGNSAVKRYSILISIALLTLVVLVNATITLISMNSRFLLVDMEARGHHRVGSRELKRASLLKRNTNVLTLFPEQPSGSGILDDELEDEEQNERRNEVLHSRLVATVRLAETLKIFMNYLQVNSAALYLQTSWNAAIDGVLSGEATVAGLSGSLFSVPLECSFEDQDSIPASIAAFWMRLAIPWIVLGILLLLCLFSWAILKRQSQFFAQCTVERLITYVIVIAIATVYFTFLDIIRELLRAVNCVEIDPAESYVASDHSYIQYAIETSGKRVWAEDTAVICYEGPHLAVGIVGYIGLFLVFFLVVGIICWLPINEKKAMKKYFIERYWFLYQAYRPQWHTTAWESTILVRKGLIAAVIVFSVQISPTLQVTMCVGILSVFLILQAWFSPFNIHRGFDNIPEYSGAFFKRCGLSPVADVFLSANNAIHLNHLELASLFSSITVFFSGIVLLDFNTTLLGTWLMVSFTIFVNVAFVLYMVFRLYYGSHLVLDKYLALLDQNFIDGFKNNLSFLSFLNKAMVVGRHKLSPGASSADGGCSN